jgi:hypothetical protein
LIKRQRLIAVVQRFLEVSGIAVEVGEGVQLRGLVALVLRGARLGELLLMQGDKVLDLAALRAGRAARERDAQDYSGSTIRVPFPASCRLSFS